MQNFTAHAHAHVVTPLFPRQFADSQMGACRVQLAHVAK